MGGMVANTPVHAFATTPERLRLREDIRAPVQRQDIDLGGLLAFRVNPVLDSRECQALIDAAEHFGFREEAPAPAEALHQAARQEEGGRADASPRSLRTLPIPPALPPAGLALPPARERRGRCGGSPPAPAAPEAAAPREGPDAGEARPAPRSRGGPAVREHPLAGSAIRCAAGEWQHSGARGEAARWCPPGGASIGFPRAAGHGGTNRVSRVAAEAPSRGAEAHH